VSSVPKANGHIFLALLVAVAVAAAAVAVDTPVSSEPKANGRIFQPPRRVAVVAVAVVAVVDVVDRNCYLTANTRPHFGLVLVNEKLLTKMDVANLATAVVADGIVVTRVPKPYGRIVLPHRFAAVFH